MARSIQVGGLDELAAQLDALANAAEPIARASLYEGARVVADALASAARSLPSGAVLSPEEAEEIASSVGIAKFDGKGASVSTAISFNGYLSRTEKNHPRGVPIPMIVRAIDKGSSHPRRKKKAFIRKTVRGAEGEATAAMQAKLDEMTQQIVK